MNIGPLPLISVGDGFMTLRKEKCPDCEQCQMCSKTRCRLCKEKGYKGRSCECGSSFTYGEYLAWKAKRTMNKVPDIDRWECTDCESCVNLLPDIFKRNEETGCIEVADVPRPLHHVAATLNHARYHQNFPGNPSSRLENLFKNSVLSFHRISSPMKLFVRHLEAFGLLSVLSLKLGKSFHKFGYVF
jgi:hypothetical protein